MLLTNVILTTLECNLHEDVRLVYKGGKEIVIKVVNEGVMLKSGGNYHQSLKVEEDILKGECRRKKEI